MKLLKLLFVAGLLSTFFSCGNYSEKAFINSATMNEINVVAVLPFENLSDSENGGAVISEMFETGLSRLGRFKIIERGEMIKILKSKKVNLPETVNRTTALQIAKTLGVDGVFFGSVLEYSYLREVRDGAVVAKEPAVAIHAKLLDAKSGALVWSVAHSRSSYDMLVSNRDSISRVAEVAIEKMTAPLKRRRK